MDCNVTSREVVGESFVKLINEQTSRANTHVVTMLIIVEVGLVYRKQLTIMRGYYQV